MEQHCPQLGIGSPVGLLLWEVKKKGFIGKTSFERKIKRCQGAWVGSAVMRSQGTRHRSHHWWEFHKVLFQLVCFPRSLPGPGIPFLLLRLGGGRGKIIYSHGKEDYFNDGNGGKTPEGSSVGVGWRCSDIASVAMLVHTKLVGVLDSWTWPERIGDTATRVVFQTLGITRTCVSRERTVVWALVLNPQPSGRYWFCIRRWSYKRKEKDWVVWASLELGVNHKHS